MMSAIALSSTDLQEIPEALIPQLAPRILSMLMTDKEAADYIHDKYGIPFGVRKLCDARNGKCVGPKFIRIGWAVYYAKADIDTWARREYPSYALYNPWRD